MYREMGNKALQLVIYAALLQNGSSDVARFTTHVETCLAANQDVPGCATLLEKVESGSTFLNKMFGTCCAFYRPKATVFAASDVTTVYGAA